MASNLENVQVGYSRAGRQNLVCCALKAAHRTQLPGSRIPVHSSSDPCHALVTREGSQRRWDKGREKVHA
jgi:hypothetical protein